MLSECDFCMTNRHNNKTWVHWRGPLNTVYTKLRWLDTHITNQVDCMCRVEWNISNVKWGMRLGKHCLHNYHKRISSFQFTIVLLRKAELLNWHHLFSLWPLSSHWTPLFVLLRSLWHRQNTIWYSTTRILWVSSFGRCWWTPISLWWGFLHKGMYQPCLFPAHEAHSQGVTLSQRQRLWVWVHCSATTPGQRPSHTSRWATTSQFVPTSSPTSLALVEFVVPSARFGHSCFQRHVGLQCMCIYIYIYHYSVSLQAVISISR